MSEPQSPNAGFIETVPPIITSYRSGMTLRDYFAAHAPEPPIFYIENADEQKSYSDIYFEWRWHYADKMMELRHG